MNGPIALLDSNVVIASVAAGHEHHPPSAALLNDFAPRSFAVAAHSYSEAYSQLTRRSPRALFQFDPAEAVAALESVAAQCILVGLTHGQTFDAIRVFASAGGIGPRLYDKLIGEIAVINGIGSIVTWNVSHFTSIFPHSAILNPFQFASARRPTAPHPTEK